MPRVIQFLVMLSALEGYECKRNFHEMSLVARMPFPPDLGTIACRCVTERGAPVLSVSHAGGDWQMYCHFDNHDFDDEEAMERDMVLIHVSRLVAKDPTLAAVADLPIDMGAQRERIGGEWSRFRDADED